MQFLQGTIPSILENYRKCDSYDGMTATNADWVEGQNNGQ
jgi:hypothetical protein